MVGLGLSLYTKETSISIFYVLDIRFLLLLKDRKMEGIGLPAWAKASGLRPKAYRRPVDLARNQAS